MKLPPPATALRAPPSTPAKKRKIADSSVKESGVSETTQRRQWGRNFCTTSAPHRDFRLPL
jgi:hypothetical protein